MAGVEYLGPGLEPTTWAGYRTEERAESENYVWAGSKCD